MKASRANYIQGVVDLPGDKSISHRAAMLASIADGRTEITNFLAAEDCLSTLACLRRLGVDIDRDETTVIIEGVGLNGLREPEAELDCGNSGTTARLISGILAGQRFDSTLTGDGSLQRRPMSRVIDPLQKLGGRIDSNGGRMPLVIHGSMLSGIEQTLDVASAQVKSCILLAGLYADGITTVIEPTPTRDHTECMLAWLGVDVAADDLAEGRRLSVNGGSRLNARDIEVPSDISSAAFFMTAAACLPGSEVDMPSVGYNPTRKGIADVLRNLGVKIEVTREREQCGEPVADLTVRGGIFSSSDNNIINGRIIANIIDEIPVLAILGTQLDGGIEIRDAEELRVKETDRIHAVVSNLRRMNAKVDEFDDGFRVHRSDLKGSVVESFGDHRIAMAFGVAGILASGETHIDGADCAAVSFPGFFEMLKNVVR